LAEFAEKFSFSNKIVLKRYIVSIHIYFSSIESYFCGTKTNVSLIFDRLERDFCENTFHIRHTRLRTCFRIFIRKI
jgi:hypothetical protein